MLTFISFNNLPVLYLKAVAIRPAELPADSLHNGNRTIRPQDNSPSRQLGPSLDDSPSSHFAPKTTRPLVNSSP